MSLTNRQQHILGHLTELKLRIRRTGMQSYHLDGSDVTATIHSLIVKEIVVKEACGRRIVMTESGRNALAEIAKQYRAQAVYNLRAASHVGESPGCKRPSGSSLVRDLFPSVPALSG